MSFLPSFFFLLFGGCQALNPFVPSSLDRDGDGVSLGEDCDDTNPEIGVLTWYVDNDHDGFGTTGGITQCEALDGYADREGDCDDSDPNIRPDADEVCDTIDNNCDGVTDDDAVDREIWYRDADGDEYGDADNTIMSCGEPAGYVLDTTDCDDANVDVHPDAVEICEDKIDNDCDGEVDTDALYVTWYRDADGDGYGDVSSTTVDCQEPEGYIADATDCDDTDALVNPGAEEVCNDWVDNDCDGEAEECLWSEDQLLAEHPKITGVQVGDRAGSSMQFMDVNQDGMDDIIVGSPGDDHGAADTGAVYIFLSPIEEGLLTDAYASLWGSSSEENVGQSLLSEVDLTNDGLQDLLIGSSTLDEGSVYLVDSIISGASSLSDVAVQIVGEQTGDRAGACLEAAGDMNDDGFPDAWIGAYLATGDIATSGAVYLLTGPVEEASVLLADLPELSGEEAFDRAGWSIASGEDVSGDGISDVLTGAFLASDESRSQTGKVYLLHGPITSSLSLTDAESILTGEAASDRLGFSLSIVPDYNDDGLPDVLIGAYYESSAFTQAGAAYLITSWTEEIIPVESYDMKLTGSSVEELAGWSVGWQEDVGSDGQDDLLIGAYKADTDITQSGALYLLETSPGEGVWDLANVCLSFSGEATDDQAGYAFASNGDLNQDAYLDLLIGAPEYAGVGAVYLVYGTGM